jgi:hypothetical protein
MNDAFVHRPLGPLTAQSSAPKEMPDRLNAVRDKLPALLKPVPAR